MTSSALISRVVYLCVELILLQSAIKFTKCSTGVRNSHVEKEFVLAVERNPLISALTKHMNKRSETSTSTTFTDTTDTPTLYFLAMAPYPAQNVGWDGGPGIIPAARLAVEQINNKTDILGQHRVALIEHDDGCRMDDKALLGYTEHVFHSGKNIVGIIGPACSNGAILLGGLSIPSRSPLVQVTIASSSALQNRKAFPYTFGTVSSHDHFIQAFLSLVSHQNWKRIGVVYYAYSQFFRRIVDDVLAETKNSSLKVKTFLMYDTYSPISEIIESEFRIIAVLMPPRNAEQFICDAYRHKSRLAYPTYQWIFFERSNIVHNLDGHKCSKQQFISAFEKAIFFSYNFESIDRTNATESGLTFDDYFEAYTQKVKEHERETGLNITEDFKHAIDYAPVYHDATWALALSLDAVVKVHNFNLSTNRRPGSNESLQLAELLKEHLQQLKFQGVSGLINFDEATGQTSSRIDLLQVQDDKLRKIGYYLDDIRFECQNGSFIDDTFEERYIGIPIAVTVVVLCVTSILFITAAFFHVINIVYASHKVIKASSPALNHLIFIGYYVVAIGIMTYVGVHFNTSSHHQQVNVVLCNAFHWEIIIGVNMVLAVLCLKTWRIYRIFIHYQNPGGTILTNPVLILLSLLLLLPSVISFIFGVTFDPVTWTHNVELIPIDQQNNDVNKANNMPIFEKRGECVIPLWTLILNELYNGFLLLCALVLAILSRHINKRYRTIKSISALIYTEVAVSVIGLSLYFVSRVYTVHWGINVPHIVLCTYLNVLLLLCVIFLFAPPTLSQFKDLWENHKQASRRGSVQSTTAATHMSTVVSVNSMSEVKQAILDHFRSHT